VTLGQSAYRKSSNKQTNNFIRQNQILEIKRTQGGAVEDSYIFAHQAVLTDK
jgi:hypothetical protein